MTPAEAILDPSNGASSIAPRRGSPPRDLACCLLALAWFVADPARALAQPQQRMTRVSQSTPTWGNQYSGYEPTGGSMSVSADGRYTAFDSWATNLVDKDVNGNSDPYGYTNVFIRETATGRLVRITSGNGVSFEPVLSSTGRFVAFVSYATNLVSGDRNGTVDVFLHDRDPDANGVFDEGNGTTQRISVTGNGSEIHGDCSHPSISDNGAGIVFTSAAADVVSGDTNGSTDAFMRDVKGRTTTRVSVSSNGAQLKYGATFASIAPDGHTVAFESSSPDVVSGDTNGAYDVFLYDVTRKLTIERVSLGLNEVQGNGDSWIVPRCLSRDGSIVAFSSRASNLVPKDSNSRNDVFIRNRTAKQTTLASRSTSGAFGNGDSYDATIDAAGDRVAFHSDATNFDSHDIDSGRDVYVHDFGNSTTSLVSADRRGYAASGVSNGGVIAPAGDVVVFDSDVDGLVWGDTNGVRDVLVRNLATATTTGVSVGAPLQATGNTDSWFTKVSDVSADGRWVAFASQATNLVPNDTNGACDVFVLDRVTNAVIRVSEGPVGVQGNDDSYYPSISSDGRFVSFISYASNWISNTGYGDVWVVDRDPDANGVFDEGSMPLDCVTWSSTYGLSAHGAFSASVSDDGRYVAFDTNGGWMFDSRCSTAGFHDIFVRDRTTGATTLVTLDSTGTTSGNDMSINAAISADGRHVAFESSASNLHSADTDHNRDIYENLVSGGSPATLQLLSVNAVGHKQTNDCMLGPHSINSDGSSVVFCCNDWTFDPTKHSLWYDVFRSGPSGATCITTLDGRVLSDNATNATISRNGRYVAFATVASDFLPLNDANHDSDCFYWDDVARGFTCASLAPSGATGDLWSDRPVPFESNGLLLFTSSADDLVPGDTNAAPDTFVFDPRY